jgi:hypothetical protein
VRVTGDAAVDEIPPGDETVVCVVAPVPAVAAVYVMVACAFPPAAETEVGCPGLFPAVTEFEEADVAKPYAVDALTVNV